MPSVLRETSYHSLSFLPVHLVPASHSGPSDFNATEQSVKMTYHVEERAS